MTNHKPTGESSQPGRSARRFGGKHATLVGGFGILILFPDVVFHLLFEVLHIVIGTLELGLEHALHSALHVSRHTAQMLTAWIGLALLIVLLAWLYRRFGPRARKLGSRYRRLGKQWVEKFRAWVPGL